MPRNPGLYDGIPLGFSGKPRMKTKNILLLSMAIMAPAWAGVLPNDAIVDGRSLSEWTAEWAKWSSSQPTNNHPWLDPDGRWATNEQPAAPVFFVVGLSGDLVGPGTLTRTFSIPEDKYLFFPLLDVAWENIDTIPPLTVEELRDAAAFFISTVSELHLSIDGIPVPALFQHRLMSPVYSYVLSDANNLKSLQYGHPITGLIDPEVSDGYWVMIEPLAPGVHVINWGGTLGPQPLNFPLDITDVITVVAIPIVQRVQELISSVTANLPGKRTRPLLRTLQGAAKSFEREHLHSGIRHLRAFQKKVRHEITRTDPALAEQLIAAAQQIIVRANQDLKKVHNHDGAQP